MSRIKKNPTQPRYGGFVLAATAYITGILLFSFWSYATHQSTLLKQMDKTLLDAAFSMQEILGTNYISTQSTETETVTEKQQSLTRLARYGAFNSVEVVLIRNEKVTPLIKGFTTDAHAGNGSFPLPSELEKALLKLAGSGANDTHLISAGHSSGADLRYAIRYEAKYEHFGIAFLVAQDRKIIHQELADQALRLVAADLGMLLLAIPLISLFSRTQKKAAEELSVLNTRLQHDVELQQSREEELKDAISDLERFNAVSSGREMRIIELKAEVNELLLQLKREKRYNIDKID